MSQSELFLVNGRLLDPATGVDGVRTVHVVDGRIRSISADLPSNTQGVKVIDCAGKLVLPGFIDLHAHLREPGEEYKETILTGARSAVAGGFTAVVAMPNTRPPIDNAHLVRFVLDRAAEAGLARVYPSGAISKGQEGKDLAEIGDMVQAGAVCITDDGRPVMDPALMRRALEYAKTFDLPVMVHEEDLHLAAGGCMNEGAVSTRLGLRGSPNVAEDAMVLRDIELCALTGGRLHIAHLSTAGSVRAVRDAKRRGLRVTAEATPHHFTLTDEAVGTYDTRAKMCPPLRTQADVDAVLVGLADGTIDAIATDHAPHSAVEKDVEFERAANGIVGLETALPLTLALVRSGAISLMRAVELLSLGPAKAFGLPGGRVAEGEVADLAIVDPEAEWRVDPARFESKGRYTPFEGWTLRGRVDLTLVGGAIVYESKESGR
ncbi:dihydroorotase [Vulgatibacter incomptus]|uniref:Dihydroorotase n=1 Tax=Vulgatibacter incomptus TaxID=1391653 RepID=A0A0K1PBV7_9BACT|nr:dihydroorotase [Vulgatibacter incomptus]AKU91023.1 Dihydroorotase [Vulgatibacter incomptus]